MPKKRKSKSSQSSPSLIADLRRLYYHLSRRRRWQLGALLGLMVVTSLAEMVSVGALFPFLSALGNAEELLQQARCSRCLSYCRLIPPSG